MQIEGVCPPSATSLDVGLLLVAFLVGGVCGFSVCAWWTLKWLEKVKHSGP